MSELPDWLASGRGTFVAVDNAWVLDGSAIRVDLDVFQEVDWEGEVECKSEEEIRQALIERGADEANAERVARWVWSEHSGHLSSPDA